MAEMICVEHRARKQRLTFWQRWQNRMARRRQLRDLRRLDQHLLADIGRTALEVEAEIRRVKWDVPRFWRL